LACSFLFIFYNGWKHDHFISNILCFAPNGTIVSCVINAPGSLHDSTIAEFGGLYDKLQAVFEHFNAKCVQLFVELIDHM